ncbi:MAG TPA: HFLK protein [Candidatus Avimonas sp.]|jgi:hypothetical protein|nr:HFLK protein [Clostridiales bacterium]HOB35884.1 HFLK protein [Candidatus Avimonas sp.]HQA15384.1 HFLK protein [Candidatus Avimonas sp.]HQD37344.1 HFLK protein [Candidatus Avimonas sp.]
MPWDGDYGVYGKGYEGYSHYLQAMKEAERRSPGRGPRRNKNNSGGGSGSIVLILLAVLIYAVIKTLLE